MVFCFSLFFAGAKFGESVQPVCLTLFSFFVHPGSRYVRACAWSFSDGHACGPSPPCLGRPVRRGAGRRPRRARGARRVARGEQSSFFFQSLVGPPSRPHAPPRPLSRPLPASSTHTYPRSHPPRLAFSCPPLPLLTHRVELFVRRVCTPHPQPLLHLSPPPPPPHRNHHAHPQEEPPGRVQAPLQGCVARRATLGTDRGRGESSGGGGGDCNRRLFSFLLSPPRPRSPPPPPHHPNTHTQRASCLPRRTSPWLSTRRSRACPTCR